MLNLALHLIHPNFHSGERCSRSLGNFFNINISLLDYFKFPSEFPFPHSLFHCSLCLTQKERVFFKMELPSLLSPLLAHCHPLPLSCHAHISLLMALGPSHSVVINAWALTASASLATLVTRKAYCPVGDKQPTKVERGQARCGEVLEQEEG